MLYSLQHPEALYNRGWVRGLGSRASFRCAGVPPASFPLPAVSTQTDSITQSGRDARAPRKTTIMSDAKSKTGGLAGVSAGQTAISTVGEGHGLCYRGYSIDDLAEKACFEEVAYLLLRGSLPTRQQLEQFRSSLESQREVPAALRDILEKLPASTHPMDILRTGCSVLGCLEPEADSSQQDAIAVRLMATFPGMLLYWHRFHQEGIRIETASDADSLAEHFLAMLHGKKPDPLWIRAMDASLTLYAEHEFNASTFSARVTVATRSDFYSAVTSAIGTLRGPLHGGANEAAMELIDRYQTADEAEAGLLKALENRELVMGFGHRVYKTCDPRSDIIKTWSKKLADSVGDSRLYPVSERIEQVMWNQKKLFPNLDFLQRLGLSLYGDSHADVYAYLCLLTHFRLGRSHFRTTR